MSSIHNTTLLSALLLFASACGDHTERSKESKGQNGNSLIDSKTGHRIISNWLELDDAIPDDEAEILAADLETLEHGEFENSESLRSMMGLETVSGPRLKQWFAERVKFVLSEFAKLEPGESALLHVDRQNVIFPEATHPGVYAAWKFLFSAANAPSSFDSGTHAVSATVVATNVGAGIYMAGKYEFAFNSEGQLVGKIYGVDFNGRVIPVNSPRVGFMQVGPGLFTQNKTASGTSYVDRILRISTLLHEARHGDGHGESLAFSHFKCPKGHVLEGKFGCDAAENGPYGVEVQFLRSAARACGEKCSEDDREVLRIHYLDAKSRVTPLLIRSEERAKIAANANALRTKIGLRPADRYYTNRLNNTLEVNDHLEKLLDKLTQGSAPNLSSDPEYVELK